MTEKSSIRGRFIGRPIFLIPFIALVLLVGLFLLYYKPSQIWYREARKERVLTAQLAAIQAYNSQLKDDISSLETTAGVSDYARQELNLVEQGEHLVIVTKDGKPLKKSNDKQVADLMSIPQTARPFGAWTAFLDKLFAIEIADAGE